VYIATGATESTFSWRMKNTETELFGTHAIFVEDQLCGCRELLDARSRVCSLHGKGWFLCSAFASQEWIERRSH
jgi:hypothetical protein